MIVLVARRSFQRPPLFSWTVVTCHGGARHVGACGVCDDRARAISRLGDALLEAPPGAVGLVHRVTVGGVRPGYLYDGLIARARRNDATGGVDWLDTGVPSGPRGRVDALLAAMADTVGGAPPPEAVALGLADPEIVRLRTERP
ncbi:hypothetical protein [Thermomonospora umbrina]|uniref:Uncharacterized protein n=1 Tax=Thermomonospora umbrina TaxID=111806 RepID=A0A3D9ST24_9ACTN|nr:hypothetical protein [Thermomonospora umbrina]REE94851.1 hypothetical protein DFJ69_0220 [Thermomonospora umbrina]